MDTTLLRKLTRKSTMKFGQYSDSTVGQILSLAGKRYLRWVYYNCSMITFMDDILEEINITEEFRIEKPGKDSDMYQKLMDLIDEHTHGLSKHIIEKKKKKHLRRERANKMSVEKKFFSKGMMQRRNHGKK